jgi:hypothetical protein
MDPRQNDWLTSTDARKAMRISTCDLAHMREAGALRFCKRGNSYLYAREDVAKHAAADAEAPRTKHHD